MPVWRCEYYHGYRGPKHIRAGLRVRAILAVSVHPSTVYVGVSINLGT